MILAIAWDKFGGIVDGGLAGFSEALAVLLVFASVAGAALLTVAAGAIGGWRA